MTAMTTSQLIDWLKSFVGQTIRGRIVEDADINISVDGSALVTAWLSPHGETRLKQHSRGTEQLFAHIDNIDAGLIDLRWEWPDEEADRLLQQG